MERVNLPMLDWSILWSNLPLTVYKVIGCPLAHTVFQVARFYDGALFRRISICHLEYLGITKPPFFTLTILESVMLQCCDMFYPGNNGVITCNHTMYTMSQPPHLGSNFSQRWVFLGSGSWLGWFTSCCLGLQPGISSWTETSLCRLLRSARGGRNFLGMGGYRYCCYGCHDVFLVTVFGVSRCSLKRIWNCKALKFLK